MIFILKLYRIFLTGRAYVPQEIETCVAKSFYEASQEVKSSFVVDAKSSQ